MVERFRSSLTPYLLVILLLGALGFILWFLWPLSPLPSIESLTLSTEFGGPPLADIALNDNATKTVVAYGTFRTEKGCGAFLNSDTSIIEARFYHSGSICEKDSDAHDARCYWVKSSQEQRGCVIRDCQEKTALTAQYVCTFPVQFFAASTDEGSDSPEASWTLGVRARHAKGAQGEERRIAAEMLTLTAIDLPATISYGDVEVNGVSKPVGTPVVNTGNNPRVTLAVSGTDFACTQGKAPVELVHYSLGVGGVYDAHTPLTKQAKILTAVLPVQTSAQDRIQQSVYWQVMAPRSVGSECTNRITIVAGS